MVLLTAILTAPNLPAVIWPVLVATRLDVQALRPRFNADAAILPTYQVRNTVAATPSA